MASHELDKEYKGIAQITLISGWLIILFHLYVFTNNSLSLVGLDFVLLDNFIRLINKSFHLFENHWASKLAALIPLLIYAFGNKPKKAINITWLDVYRNATIGLLLFFGSILIFSLGRVSLSMLSVTYSLLVVTGYLLIQRAGTLANRIIHITIGDDPFNKQNESFKQEEKLLENEYSVNIPTQYTFRGKMRKGWLNIVNPMRATIVLGTPGSGKSFAIVNNFIRQFIEKGYTVYIYDYKFPDLTKIAYHYLQKNLGIYKKLYGVTPRFYMINFDDPRRSHRCNPLLPELMTDIVDAVESAETIMLNLNRTWIKKQGDFFTESAITFVAACIWYLKLYDDERMNSRREAGLPDDGVRYCTFPHAIELVNKDYDRLFPVLQTKQELMSLLVPFASALAKEAFEQLEGQIASARIGLGRIASPALYWVLSNNDFSLDINNPKEPKILCTGNNPDRQKIYGAALGLINARLIKIINKKKKAKSGIIIDELPTIYFKGLDNLIATARSNKVATCLVAQDASQLTRDYGKEEATVVLNTIGNILSGQVKGETAKNLSSSFGKNRQQGQSFNFSEKEVTTNISDRMDTLIPESTISTLSQGQFVGSVADNNDEVIEQKIFHAQLIVEPAMIKDMENLEDIPMIPELANLSDEAVKKIQMENFLKIKADVENILIEQMGLLENGPIGAGEQSSEEEENDTDEEDNESDDEQEDEDQEDFT